MALSIGIVGLPNVGKSTLFNALLKKQQALAANYPFATIEPNVGIVPVPDHRLAILADVVHQSEGAVPPLVPATVKFTDIAGIVKGASQGEGLGNKFLAHIREASAIAMVLRSFANEDVVETGSGDLKADYDTLMTELILADMQTLEKQQMPKGKVAPEVMERWEAIQKITTGFNEGIPVTRMDLSDEQRELTADLCLMTAKKVLVVVNAGEAEFSGAGVEVLQKEYASKIGISGEDVIVVCAQIESDLSSLDEIEQREYLTSLGLSESGLERLIKASYHRLGLQSFLTAGEKEVRAWTIKQGMNAVEAAGVIHTDFMKKFIRAEVVAFDDFVETQGWKKARELGKMRSEGRDYQMCEGDVVEFRIGA